ncbi:ammonia-dependent NAD(+) synthetase [Alicyclobacillus shizuokensis]|uniref:ammonia-dependent NAD(+) synthetase n=1 Tax=Alicyclobacillus shizuokensis TaxID=392014 RepID=UPI00083488E4|nr:ammonia-dependent NAD(+) synthetase [Alicyclobacillus shizuokensis]
MRPLQQEIIKALGVKPVIDPEQEIRARVNFLKDYLKFSGSHGYVLGISGGQDSCLAGKLAQLAVSELRRETDKNNKFVAVRLPYGRQKDEEDAQRALRFIDPDEIITFNIEAPVLVTALQYHVACGEPLSDYHKGNVKARMRMIAQYAIGGQQNLLVVGTDHAAEAVTGFYTKYGDGGADILPLSGLNKRQGKMILQALGADVAIYNKTPTADLLDEKPQQADEAELGISYHMIDDYLEGKDVPQEIAQKIEARYIQTTHKRQMPATMRDGWWKN